MTPRGIRNNNPGNLERTDPRAGWLGAVAAKDLTDERFEQFLSPAFGLRALVITLHSYQERHACHTPMQIASRFAPYPENNATVYAARLAYALGVTYDFPVDLRDPVLMARIVAAIVLHENGVEPYGSEMIDMAVRSAMPPPAESDADRLNDAELTRLA